jgi:hypothetical protein
LHKAESSCCGKIPPGYCFLQKDLRGSGVHIVGGNFKILLFCFVKKFIADSLAVSASIVFCMAISAACFASASLFRANAALSFS